jgi:LPS-assembly lipoprotein
MWSRNRLPANRLAASGVVAAGLLALGACGFQPMYASQAPAGSGQIAPEVPNSVAIAPIPERIGQQLHNALRDRLNPQGQPRDPAYRLKVSIGSVSEPSTLRNDGTATRRNFRLKANWQLDDYARRTRLFRSTATVTASYNVVDQPYATVAAFRDAQARAVDQVARDIAARVSAVLAAGPRSAEADTGE